MSTRPASERLRKLDAATPLEKYEINLFQYLPLIADCIEAAERLADSSDDDWFYGGGRAQTARALTALRNSLEKGTE